MKETTSQYLTRIWGNTKWKCGITGVERQLPNVITRGQFFSFGDSFIDVGDEYYSRFGGNPVEIKDE